MRPSNARSSSASTAAFGTLISGRSRMAAFRTPRKLLLRSVRVRSVEGGVIMPLLVRLRFGK